MKPRLAFGKDYLEIVNFSYCKSEAERGNPYNTTFDLVIQSGVFCGIAPFEYDVKAFVNFVDTLRRLYNFEVYNVLLDDLCYGSKVRFQMDSAGHIEISGKIFGRAMIHSMEFCFSADQTVLRQFITELEELLRQFEI